MLLLVCCLVFGIRCSKYEPKFEQFEESPKNEKCGSPAYKGDGFCDDDNNSKACGFDDGDCCGDVLMDFCTECECLEPKGPKGLEKCGSPDYIGDNYCDDENNNEDCGFDDGDCCGDVNTDYCTKCECLEPKGPKAPTEPKEPKSPKGPKGPKAPTEPKEPKGPKDSKGPKGPKAPTEPKGPKGPSSKECGSPDYIGDNYCDDENNNEACGFDDGDCCGDVHTDYCTKCECLEPKFPKGPKGPKGPKDPKDPSSQECGLSVFRGDGFCDDDNNSEACGFDDGDCCGDVLTDYCTICECLDPKGPKGPEKCGLPDYIGDGFCDDDNNNEACGFDNGDCCGNVLTDFCTKCECLDPKGPKDPKGPSSEECGSPDYVGDDYCDDENNNEACGFDGGDCCGDVKMDFCTKCECMN